MHLHVSGQMTVSALCVVQTPHQCPTVPSVLHQLRQHSMIVHANAPPCMSLLTPRRMNSLCHAMKVKDGQLLPVTANIVRLLIAVSLVQVEQPVHSTSIDREPIALVIRV